MTKQTDAIFKAVGCRRCGNTYQADRHECECGAPLDKIIQEDDDEAGSYWAGGVFCGKYVGDGFFAEAAASKRLVIHRYESGRSAYRMGEVFGPTGAYQACTMRGEHVANTRTLMEACQQLAAHQSKSVQAQKSA